MKLRQLVRKQLSVWMGWVVVSFGVTTAAHAEVIQILHTNDLHSSFDRADDPSRGGYAAVASTLHRLRHESAQQGISTLSLDGGDFSEGTAYYLADRGVWSWRLTNELGHDAVTLGNHDWQAGPGHLDEMIARSRPTFTLLAANFHCPKKYRFIRAKLRKSTELRIGGVRVGIVGVAPATMEFEWMAEPCQITNPVVAVNDVAETLRPRNDVVIALTHVGLSKDRELAKKSKNVDLIIGAHSHDELPAPLWIKNRKGRRVPVFQTGSRGAWVGRILLEVLPGQAPRVLSSELIPVDRTQGEDSRILGLIRESREALERHYGAGWLEEPIGASEVPIEWNHGAVSSDWSRFTVEAIREAVGAEVAIDSPEFRGVGAPPGLITRETLFNSYPRVFGFQHPGWTIWTIRMEGWALEMLRRQTKLLGLPIVFSKRGDRPFSPFREYVIAVPEGIGTMVNLYKTVVFPTIGFARDTQIPLLTALEARLRRLGTLRAN